MRHHAARWKVFIYANVVIIKAALRNLFRHHAKQRSGNKLKVLWTLLMDAVFSPEIPIPARQRIVRHVAVRLIFSCGSSISGRKKFSINTERKLSQRACGHPKGNVQRYGPEMVECVLLVSNASDVGKVQPCCVARAIMLYDIVLRYIILPWRWRLRPGMHR